VSADESSLQRAISLHRQGEIEEAEKIYEDILRIDTRNFEALHMLGVAALQRGDHPRAVDLIALATRTNPRSAAAYANLGTALLAQERHQEALACYDRALQLDPDSPGVLFNRGNTLRRVKKHREAVSSYDRALQLLPDYADAFCNRGMALMDLGRPLEALTSFEMELGLRPDDPIALTNRAHALLELQRPEEALASCQRALEHGADHPDAHYNLGSALLDLSQPEAALRAFDRVLTLDPGYAKAHHNRGNALWRLDRNAEALASYDRALQLMPGYVSALYNRGDVLQALGRPEEAARSFGAGLQLAPDYDYALGQWVRACQASCDWTYYADSIGTLKKTLTQVKRSATPFVFLTAVDSPSLALECARLFVADRCPPRSPLWTGERYEHERIRIAYFSADFHEHATTSLMAGLFERHDRTRFETSAISFGPDSDRPMRARLKRSFDHFFEVRTLSDRDVAKLVKDAQIDIAVDLKGFTGDARPQIFASRPAPVQVNYLGFPGTMAAPYIDYILADRQVIPQESADYYSEKVVYLPDCYQVNDATRPIAPLTPTRAELGLPEDGFVFCSFNNSYKLTPPFFEVWMRLLQRVSGSVLWLLTANDAMVRNLRREAVQRGVAPERLVFAPQMAPAEHLARQKAADLFLDTLPCNAHTTASDALWAGLPVLTCAGEGFAGRVAASLLHTIGLPELITHSLPEYEERALQLATTPPLLAELRARLAEGRGTSPLFDTARFCRHLEAAYITMWEGTQRGDAPASFSVPAVDP
jgi:protein O-GlcNAc transferase